MTYLDKSRKGFVMLECILGTALLTVSSILVLESATALFKWSRGYAINTEVSEILRVQQKYYEDGYSSVQNQSGFLSDGTPYRIELLEDTETMPPLERADICLKWGIREGKYKKYMRTQGIRLRHE